jgi:hypothetical protein
MCQALARTSRCRGFVPRNHVLVQDYKADCEELEHPTIKDMAKLRMSTLRTHYSELVKAYNRTCARLHDPNDDI